MQKGWKARLLQLAFTQTIYSIWRLRNANFFGDQRYVSIDLKDDIIETIMYRSWSSKKLRKHIANLMC